MSHMKEILGIDVGATGIKGGIVDLEKGKLITERYKLLTPENKKPNAIADTVRQISEKFNWKNQPIGIGFPAVIKNNKSATAANIDKSWIGLNVKDLFSNATNNKCTVFNDADAAGIAEMTFGIGHNVKGTVLLLTLGTGIGSALFRDGILIPNLELGHLIYKEGIAEQYASNHARKSKDLSWEKYGNELNEVLNHIDFLFSPDLMVIGGGISKKFKEYGSYISSDLNVKPALHHNNAGIIGAAMSVLYKQKNKGN